MTLDATTSTRAKLALKLSSDDTSQDAWLTAAIDAVSVQLEKWLGRHFESTSRTVYLDVAGPRTESFQLSAVPVSSITSIKNSATWDWATQDAIDTEDYFTDEDSGEVFFNRQLQKGPRALQVVYTGGLAADSPALIAAYPEIAQAADLQIASMYRRRSTPQGTSTSPKGGGSLTFEGPLELIKASKELISHLRIYHFA